MFTLAFLILSTPINGHVDGLTTREVEHIYSRAVSLFEQNTNQSVNPVDILNLKSTTVWKLNLLYPHNGLIVGNYNRETHTVYVATDLGDIRCHLFHEIEHFLFHTSGLYASTDNDGEHIQIHKMEKIYNPACEVEDGS